MRATLEKINMLKVAEQDYEWYPTTDEMITTVFRSLNGDTIGSMLDIGAGDGRVLEKFDKLTFAKLQKDRGWTEYVSTIDKFAIEKSEVHISNMPPDISIVGTDFLAQTLIDKKVDVIFCNPPYSQYEEWAVKIIKEATCKHLFMVLPSRWSASKVIKQAMKARGLTSRTIWSGDFLEADRKARAKVEILKIDISRDRYCDRDTKTKDSFDVWFDEYFAGFQRLNHTEDVDDRIRPNRIEVGELVEGQNLIERLCSLYDNEMKTLLNNYITLSNLDSSLLKELGVQVSELKKGLRSKIDGVKNKYWQELFDRFSPITDKLTSGSRKSILEKLHASCNVDFSYQNAYAIAIWTIKNANKYIDNQVVDIFKELSEPACVKNYKSNLKTWENDRWRYKNEKTHTKYILDYRIVTQRHNAIYNGDGFGKYAYSNGLSDSCHDFLCDILTIANNLSFFNSENSRNYN